MDDAAHRITTLDSGVRVVSERMPAVRSVALGFWIGTGSALERDEQAGISHLLEHMLFRGTSRYGSAEIDEIFDAMGAELNAGTDKETTSVYTRVLDRHLEQAFDVIADMVWRPRFGELEAEREVVLEEIAMYEDDPQDRVFDVLGEAVFGTHPLGRAVIGRAEVVGAVTREQLRAFHGERYTPPRIVISASGSVDHDALVELARTAEGRGGERPRAAEPAGADPAADVTGAAAGAEGPASTAIELQQLGEPQFERRVRFLRKDTEQYHLCLGGRGIARTDDRRFALRVLDTMLGGGASSRIFQEVRERRGLAYSVFSFSSTYAATGEVGLYVGTRPENLADAIAVIASELERFVREPPQETELARSRENAKGRLVLSLESTSARMNRLGGSVLAGLPILSVEEIIARIDAVSVDDVRALADELFGAAGLSVAAIGPDEDALRSALAPLEQVAA
ncbi:MAG TPA: pitrilysin family protein [Solirubrobacteraceae bacterium]|jgi:predicted Zn-dependent peptidase|nr:pitrilysin family protein [Solirubrobacteraceae bacterium]